MNDKEAFDQWLKTKSWITVSDHAKMFWCLEAWQAACEYKQKEIDELKEEIKNIWKEAEEFYLDD